MNKFQKEEESGFLQSCSAEENFGVGPSDLEQERMVEAMLFASASPISLTEIRERMPTGSDPQAAIKRLKEIYLSRGINLVKINQSYAFRTASDLKILMKKEIIEHRKLSKAAIETLAIIAYHANSTRAEIEEIRGVSVSMGTLDILMELGWVKVGRRRKTPGRPATFLVTEVFMDYFGLEKLEDLPGLQELKETALFEQTNMLFD